MCGQENVAKEGIIDRSVRSGWRDIGGMCGGGCGGLIGDEREPDRKELVSQFRWLSSSEKFRRLWLGNI